MASSSDTSPIHIFREFERLVNALNVFPLSKKNLVIQQDAFSRLGGMGEEEVTAEPFATLELGKKETDQTLRFLLSFTDIGVLLEIEGWGQMFLQYQDFGKTQVAIAKKIFSVASMLSNGQIFVLHTARHDRLCATELIFKEGPRTLPVLLAVQENYPKFMKNAPIEEYETHLMKNQHDTPFFKERYVTSIRATKSDGSALVLPRVYEHGTLTPLTKEAYKSLINSVGNEMVGVSSDRELEEMLVRTPEFWFIAIAASIAAHYVLLRQFEAPPLFAVLIGFVVSGYFTTKFLMYKQEVLLTDKKTWYIYISEYSAKILTLANFYAAGLVGLLISTGFPIYVAKETSKIVDLNYITEHVTGFASAGFIIPFLALVLTLWGRKTTRVLGALFGILSVVSLVYINTLTDTSSTVATPEPQTSIALGTYLYVSVLSIVIIVRTLQSRKKRT